MLFPALESKASLACTPYLLDHEAENELFGSIEGLLADVQSGAGPRHSALASKLERQIVALNAVLALHSRKEDTHLFALAKERLGIEEQAALASQAPRYLPQEIMPQLLPRVVRALTIDEQEDYLRMMMRVVPNPVFLAMAGWVKAGLGAEEWTTLVGRIPELASTAG
ncbi:MAG: hypothetical protein HYY30_10730 [Chloroflexi bacterium]|nr:hypothetical protein [Chloroflexota bacterium]